MKKREFKWENGRPLVVEQVDSQASPKQQANVSLSKRFPKVWNGVKVSSTVGGAIAFVVMVLELAGLI